MHHVGQQLPVHLLHFGPIGAVHVWHVEIVAFIAPAFVEDLRELRFRIEIHPQRNVQTARARLRWCAIRIDDEQLRWWRRGETSAARTTLATAKPGTIDNLAAIGADVVSHHIIDERRDAAIAQAITHQLARIGARAAALAAASRFEKKHRAVNTSRQNRILSLGHTRYSDDSLLQSVEIDLHRDWTTWFTRRCSLASSLTFTTTSSRRARRRFAATATGRRIARARRRTSSSTANATILIALRQQRTLIALLQHREVETKVFVVIVRSHVEPLRTQTEIGRREEPQIFAARVPRRPHRIGESVSDLLRLTRLDVADEDRVIQRTQTARIRDPLRIRTPRRVQRARRHHPRILAHDLRVS